MNKRQWEKRYKRKWQQLMSDKASELLHIKVKPSRIKMRTEKNRKLRERDRLDQIPGI